MAGICEGRVVIVTGSGRGLGRAHALEFAKQGAKVVVNDVGAELDGTGSSSGPAGEVVNEIRGMGGEAIANGDDVADWEGAKRIIDSAIKTFGDVHVLVNNAGILRDRMLINMTPEEWDGVIRVHLRGLFCMSQQVAVHWREQSKAGQAVDARIINTTSGAGLQGSIGQSNYSAAKAGVAALTLVQAAELGRYGITANAIAPAARTAMTEGAMPDMVKKPESGFDAWDPLNVASIIVWLGSSESTGVTGRCFEAKGGE
ncbi:MAG: SDR family oxidoreductase, partial [Chloroflexota bacterium]